MTNCKNSQQTRVAYFSHFYKNLFEPSGDSKIINDEFLRKQTNTAQ